MQNPSWTGERGTESVYEGWLMQPPECQVRFQRACSDNLLDAGAFEAASAPLFLHLAG